MSSSFASAVGLEVTLAIVESLYEATKMDFFKPAPQLVEAVRILRERQAAKAA